MVTKKEKEKNKEIDEKIKGLKKLKIDSKEFKEYMQNAIDEISKKYDMPVKEMHDAIVGKREEEKPKLSEKETRRIVKKNYKEIIKILRKYMVMKEEGYSLVALWIIGTYFHNQFGTYPYLFFNAMKGSGKSRILRLITTLCQGRKLASLTEAILFRTTGMLAIDEFEGIGKKGNENLRELLNSAYKKGDNVLRLRKVKSQDGESQEVEEFEVYRPIVLANIYGMEEVLGDRCIIQILEKSDDLFVTKLQEDFDENPEIKKVLVEFVEFVELFGHLNKSTWNTFLEKGRANSTYSTYTTTSTNSTYSTYTKINKSGLFGRDLELFFPLYLVAEVCGVLEQTIKFSQDITKEKREKDFTESLDVQVYDFVSQQKEVRYLPMSTCLSNFREFSGYDEKQDIWVNPRWLGRAFKRLNLVKERRKVQGRIQLILDIDKAKEKIKMFKEPGEEEQEKIEVVKIK